MLVEPALHHFSASALNGWKDRVVEQPQLSICDCRSQLDGPVGPNQLRSDRAAGEREILDRPKRVDSVQSIPRHFARALGRRAKTDRVDALVLALMAERLVAELPLWSPPGPELRELRALVDVRRQLVQDRDAYRLRRARSHDAAVPYLDALRAALQADRWVGASKGGLDPAAPDLSGASLEENIALGLGLREPSDVRLSLEVR